MNVMIDRAALEEAKRITGKATLSETINYAISEIVREQKVRDAFKFFETVDWWDGDVETLMEMRTDPDIQPERRVAAKTVRAPRIKKNRRRGARR